MVGFCSRGLLQRNLETCLCLYASDAKSKHLSRFEAPSMAALLLLFLFLFASSALSQGQIISQISSLESLNQLKETHFLLRKSVDVSMYLLSHSLRIFFYFSGLSLSVSLCVLSLKDLFVYTMSVYAH